MLKGEIDKEIDKVVNIICYAGGEITGQTRFQKIAYLLNATGLDDSFNFVYKKFGPFSEQLAYSVSLGKLFGRLSEHRKTAEWGGVYSIYRLEQNEKRKGQVEIDLSDDPRYLLASQAVKADSVVLELATTAVFLANHCKKPWKEVKRRKPEKWTNKRQNDARSLLSKLKPINLPKPFPDNVF